MEELDIINDSQRLHQFAIDYNWDDGFDIPRKIIEKECCELSTALMMFYLADGIRYLENKEEAQKSSLKEWLKFTEDLYAKIVNGEYKVGNILFEPPLSKVQKYKLQKVLSDKEHVFINTCGKRMSKKNRKKSYQEQRLLTKSEREAIINGYNNFKKNFGILVVIILVIYAIIGILFTILGSYIKEIIYFYLVTFAGLTIWMIQHFITLKIVVNKVKMNKMYGVEAVYEYTSGKYNTTYLRGYKSPSIEGYDLVKREPLEKGDRVIVLVMRYPAWMYKARE